MKGISMKMSRRTAVAAGSIATLAVTGALIAGPAFAKGGHGPRGNAIGQVVGMSDSSTAGGPMGRRGHGRGHDMDGNHGMRGDRGMGLGRMLHVEGVVAKTDAAGAVTYVTVRHQEGKVTAASDTSITVKSDDGYTATWPISATTRVIRGGAVAKGSVFVVGDVVEVRGTVTGGTVTTDDIHDHAAGKGMGLVPAPTPSASTSGANA